MNRTLSAARDEVKVGEQAPASGPSRGRPRALWPWVALVLLLE